MVNIYHRAADDLDLKALVRGRGSLGRNLLMVVLPASLVLFAGVYLLWRSLLAAGVVGVGIFLASSLSNIRFFRDVKRRESLKTNNKAVEVFDVSASRILEIEHLGSNGPALVFLAGEGKALLLVGQWLLDYDSFPCESFRLSRWTNSKKPIRIEVAAKAIRAESSAVRLKPTYSFGQIELFDGAPETLQNDLDLALGKRSR
jgi:hypothetical protein